MHLSVIQSVHDEVTRVEAVDADAERPPSERRIRIVFGAATLFIEAGEIPGLIEALKGAHLDAVTLYTEAEKASLLKSIETDN